MVQRPNWFRYYREQHDIPEMACAEDNELLLVSRETMRLALHALRHSMAVNNGNGEKPHVPSRLALNEINFALMENEGPIMATGKIFPLRQLPYQTKQNKKSP